MSSTIDLQRRRDPYEVLGVARDSDDHQIKAAYRKLALKFHPDKNSNNPEAAELFKEVAYSYGILSDPERRRCYDATGFESLKIEGMDLEIDLSNYGPFTTMIAALFSKLGVPIKTTIPATILEEALNGDVIVRPLPLGSSISGKVDKGCAHFFSVLVTDQQAQAGIVVRVTSAAQSKFKLLYFEEEANGGYGLELQEDSEKTGMVTSAGMYFLHFQVYRIGSTVNQLLATAKDTETELFKRLAGLRPCELSQLKSGTHTFAVYGDNFFKPASYTIEAICAKSYEDATGKLKEIEAKILAKRNDFRQFEIEYRKALATFEEVKNKYAVEKQAVDELLKERATVRSSFTTMRGVVNGPVNTSNNVRSPNAELENAASAADRWSFDGRDKLSKRKWFSRNCPDRNVTTRFAL